METDSGIKGYSFLGSTAEQVAQAQPVLVEQDLFQIEVHLKRGLISWGAIEEAMWDAIGKIAGEPVCRLLGGASLPNVPVYITYVWPGTNGQETITPKFQAEQAKIVKAAGFNAMKIQIFRRDYNLRRGSLRGNPGRWRPRLSRHGGPYRGPVANGALDL